jgi:hypothetical protein
MHTVAEDGADGSCMAENARLKALNAKLLAVLKCLARMADVEQGDNPTRQYLYILEEANAVIAKAEQHS